MARKTVDIGHLMGNGPLVDDGSKVDGDSILDTVSKVESLVGV